MSAVDATLPVLTWHSISAATGPTAIDPATFRMQIDELAQQGYRALGVAEFVAWRRARTANADRRVLLTFDDGFADFATTAFPVLGAHGYRAVVFVPTGRIGACEDWAGANRPPRRLLDWATVARLAAAGIEFGGHGVTHADLTRLPPAARRTEIEGSRDDLAARAGIAASSFAAPYGRVDAAVVAEIEAHFDVAFGTRFDLARRGDRRGDVPRIEMHYFRDRRRWRSFLRGDRGYFQARRALRAAGIVARGLLSRGDG